MAADLKRLDEERALLLAGVSHDLRTPLSRIRLGLEMMDDKGDAALKAGMVQDIGDIDAAINQFLDFARVSDGEAVRRRRRSQRHRARGRASATPAPARPLRRGSKRCRRCACARSPCSA